MIIGNIPKLPAKYAMFILPFFYLIFYEWHYFDDQSLAQFGLGGQFPTGLAVRMDDVLGGGISCSAHCATDCAPFDRCICRYVTFEPTEISPILAIFTA